jgi:hypothetical protein
LADGSSLPSRLTSFDMRNMEVGDEHARLLTRMPMLTGVHLGEINTRDISFISSFTKATSLTLMCCRYNEVDIAHCLEVISTMSQLRYLVFHHVGLTEEAFAKLIGGLHALHTCEICAGNVMRRPPPRSITRHLAFTFAR